jgi:hypothetical protein
MQDAELENSRLHKCAEMPSTGVHVQYGRNLSGRPRCWSLYLIREATEEDLEENRPCRRSRGFNLVGIP